MFHIIDLTLLVDFLLLIPTLSNGEKLANLTFVVYPFFVHSLRTCSESVEFTSSTFVCNVVKLEIFTTYEFLNSETIICIKKKQIRGRYSYMCRISSYSFLGNNYFLNLEIVANSNSCRNISISYFLNCFFLLRKLFMDGNYSRTETI